ncbi:polyisoprenoid-binding protein [Epibacterium sp. SM1979]|uniref:Polyisoprenoid-binding protein n=1 Tax=Tritonibacter litoralis TaxID=2662264 RepID=A0A843YL10_9RHOB|nr:YceI family protein [Tritonibacter litoralis]MQQ09849.1 polyisoprenoid-binding protein [Tritonibacter litoralis]
MSFISRSTLAAALLIATAPLAQAADKYKVHEDHTWLTFSLSHAGWANAHGIFRAVSGDITFDKDDVTKSSVSVVIAADSLDTNSEVRDRDMGGADFLNIVEFPEITFDSTRIEQTGERTAMVYGDLTMIGVSKEIALDVTWNNEMPLPWDTSTVKTGFTATATIDGTDFGMNQLVAFGLGPKIDVEIDLEALRQ